MGIGHNYVEVTLSAGTLSSPTTKNLSPQKWRWRKYISINEVIQMKTNSEETNSSRDRRG